MHLSNNDEAENSISFLDIIYTTLIELLLYSAYSAL